MADDDQNEPHDILHNWAHWVDILVRDKLQCVYCGLDGRQDTHIFRQLVMNLDHLVPRVSGGGENQDNLVTCCWPCNRWKSDFDPRDKNPNGMRRQDTPRDRMIENAKRHLQIYDWDYHEKARNAFLARLQA